MKELSCPGCGKAVRKGNAIAYQILKCRQCKSLIRLQAANSQDEKILALARKNNTRFTLIVSSAMIINLILSYNAAIYNIYIPITCTTAIVLALVWESNTRKKVINLIDNEKAILVIVEKK